MCIDNDFAAKTIITINVYFLNKTLDGNDAPCLDYEFKSLSYLLLVEILLHIDTPNGFPRYFSTHSPSFSDFEK